MIHGSSVGLCEKDCVNCENSKTPGQPPLYLHFKSVAFCPVCFLLVKNAWTDCTGEVLQSEKHHISEKFMKKVFIPRCFVEEEKWRRLASIVVNRCIPDPVSPRQKQPLNTHTYTGMYKHNQKELYADSPITLCVINSSCTHPQNKEGRGDVSLLGVGIYFHSLGHLIYHQQ